MSKLQFGTYDLFQGNVIEAGPEPVDYYDQHTKEVRLAESLGFDNNFVIEHQGNNNGQCSAPFVYLSALAQNTSTIRFGAMIFQLPFYNPLRLAQDAAMLDQLSRGRLEFGAGIGVLDVFCGRHRFADIPTPLVEKSIRLFGEKVIPALK